MPVCPPPLSPERRAMLVQNRLENSCHRGSCCYQWRVLACWGTAGCQWMRFSLCEWWSDGVTGRRWMWSKRRTVGTADRRPPSLPAGAEWYAPGMLPGPLWWSRRGRSGTQTQERSRGQKLRRRTSSLDSPSLWTLHLAPPSLLLFVLGAPPNWCPVLRSCRPPLCLSVTREICVNVILVWSRDAHLSRYFDIQLP